MKTQVLLTKLYSDLKKFERWDSEATTSVLRLGRRSVKDALAAIRVAIFNGYKYVDSAGNYSKIKSE